MSVSPIRPTNPSDTANPTSPEVMLRELQSSSLPTTSERAEIDRLAELLNGENDLDRVIATRDLEVLTNTMQDRVDGIRTRLTRSSAASGVRADAAVRALQAERDGSQNLVKALLALVCVVVIGVGGISAACMLVILRDTEVERFWVVLPTFGLWSLIAFALINVAGRLFQLARESAEKMDIRSASIQFISEAFAHAQQTDNYKPLDKILDKMWPTATAGTEAEPLGHRDYVTAVASAIRMTRNKKRRESDAEEQSMG